MLRWLSIALVLEASHVASADISSESKLLHQCRARAWVRAPDMVPGDLIEGDVKVKLIGPCPNAENYVLGLRYKERIFWKLRHQDAPLPKAPEFKNIPVDLNKWIKYKETFENKDLWTVHEEERISFEIKTTLVSAEGADSLSPSFISQFGILVPNTNYPQVLDYRHAGMRFPMMGTDISSESIYEYFVEIKFSNGTTSEISAGITTFTPYHHVTESGAPLVNFSLARTRTCSGSDLVDVLQSNYTIELSFPDGPQVYQNSSMNLVAIVHRSGYTNRTDIPVEFCAFPGNLGPTEWRSHELNGRTSSSTQFLSPLIPLPHMVPVSPPQNSRPCRNIDFATPVDLTGEGHISSTSSEPISLSFHVGHHVVLDFPTYYQKLTNLLMLNLAIKPDPLEPKDGCGIMPLNDETADMDESDYDWVPWTSRPMRIPEPMHMARAFYYGNTSISVVSMQKQGHLRPTPVHYLSEEARQPAFVAPSDIAELRLISPEERDLIAPLAQPYTKVFAKGEELRNRYFVHTGNMHQVIYVGDTWVNKVVAEGQRTMDNMEHSLVVQ